MPTSETLQLQPLGLYLFPQSQLPNGFDLPRRLLPRQEYTWRLTMRRRRLLKHLKTDLDRSTGFEEKRNLSRMS